MWGVPKKSYVVFWLCLECVGGWRSLGGWRGQLRGQGQALWACRGVYGSGRDAMLANPGLECPLLAPGLLIRVPQTQDQRGLLRLLLATCFF